LATPKRRRRRRRRRRTDPLELASFLELADSLLII
jgi:hypothetical protein